MKSYTRKFAICVIITIIISTVLVCAQTTLPYQTLSLQQLMDIYNNQKQEYIFLDVRSKGEFDDTSRWTGLRIGHVNGAINIPVSELDKRLAEIKQYKDRNIIVYCSHSYRSRRAIKMLIDSGFVHVFNTAYGLSGMYRLDKGPEGYAPGMIQRSTGYNALSAAMLYDLLRTNKNAVLVKVIPGTNNFMDSVFKSVYNEMGSFVETRTITMQQLKDNKAGLDVFKHKTIVLYSPSGAGDAEAATYLTEQGFEQVYYLFDGLMAWYNYLSEHNRHKIMEDIRPHRFMDNNKFAIVSVKQACKMVHSGNAVLLDIRSAKSYNDTLNGQVYRYTHLKNAVHIPAQDIRQNIKLLAPYKQQDIIVIDENYAPDIATLKLLSANNYRISYVPRGMQEWEYEISNNTGFECRDMLNLY